MAALIAMAAAAESVLNRGMRLIMQPVIQRDK